MPTVKIDLLKIFYSKMLTKFWEELYCRKSISAENLSMAVSVSFVPCELETPNLALFNIFICLHRTVSNVTVSWKGPVECIMLRYTGIATSLSCDYAVSSFLSIFTSLLNKSFKNLLS